MLRGERPRLAVFFAGALIVASPLAGDDLPAAAPAGGATCFCVLATDNIEGRGTTNGFHVDLTSQLNQSYYGLYQQHEDNQVDCSKRCRAQVVSYTSQAGNAAPFCQAGFPNLKGLTGFSKVGTKSYRFANNNNMNKPDYIAYLKHSPQLSQTTYTCPPTWYTGNTNILGGTSSDNGCKKLAGYLSIPPYPPNGTQLGNWGFSWANEMWARGTVANGGAATAKTVKGDPAECGFH